MPRSHSKLGQLAIIVLCAIVVWLYKMPTPTSINQPLPTPELLPISDTKPSWDGAFPFLVIRFAHHDPKHCRFEIEIASIKPTVRHETAGERVSSRSSLGFVCSAADRSVCSRPDAPRSHEDLSPMFHFTRAFGVRGDGYERQRGPPHSFEPGRGP